MLSHAFSHLLRLGTILLLLIPFSGRAQTSSDPLCPAVVDQALFNLGANCSSMGRNTACYGYTEVEAAFARAVPEGFFTQPAERSELAALQTIKTSPLDLGGQEWGIAVLNVQANVPDTLPGQAVTFLLLGDTEVENAVDPAQAAAAPATAIIQTEADILAESRADATLLGRIAAGTVLDVAEVSEDGLWLRANTPFGTGWLNRDAINQTSALSSVPVAGQPRLSPMQAFYLRTGFGGSEVACGETPSLLAIKSPENITVDLTMNGADIRLGSLITLQILPPGNTIKLTTLEGQAVLEPDSSAPVIVPAGFTTTRCLAEPNSLGIDGQGNDRDVGPDCAWTLPTPLAPEDLVSGEIVQAAFVQLGLPVTPLVSTTPLLITPVAIDCPTGSTITHTVSAGENLFRIGLRYRAGIGDIMAANGLSNSQFVFAGQQLIIPCGVDTGISSVPPVNPFPQNPPLFPTEEVVIPTGVDCSPFRATSPLDGLPYGSVTFYWDPAPGATGYRVNLYNLDETGGLVGSYSAPAGATSLSADTRIVSIGYGFSFSWEVIALLNGQTVCSSGPFSMGREAGTDDPPPFTASWSCAGAGSYTVNISYGGLPAGTNNVTISFSNAYTGGPTGGTYAASGSGSQSFNVVTLVSGGSVTALPSGITANLSGSLNCT